jgi:hypothetical protein
VIIELSSPLVPWQQVLSVLRTLAWPLDRLWTDAYPPVPSLCPLCALSVPIVPDLDADLDADLEPARTISTSFKGARSAPRADGASSPRGTATWQGARWRAGSSGGQARYAHREPPPWCGHSALAPAAHGGRPPGGSPRHWPAPVLVATFSPGAPPRGGAILPGATILKPAKITGEGAARHA